jgi:hypothetical protein
MRMKAFYVWGPASMLAAEGREGETTSQEWIGKKWGKLTDSDWVMDAAICLDKKVITDFWFEGEEDAVDDNG